jgi:hypothetical protein
MSASSSRRRPARQELSERDLAVLSAVRQHRFLTATQIERLFFTDHATPSASARICRRVLARLHRDRVLARLQRRVGGVRAGSASYVYALGSTGGQILGDRRARVTEPSTLFLDHTLAIGDARVELVEAARQRLFDLVEVEIEPECWRRFSGDGGAPATVKPDLYIVSGRDDFEDCWFMEIDRGTESPAAIARKCRAYDLYWRSGLEQAAQGTFPVVLWVTPDDRRVERLSAFIKRARSVKSELFQVTTSARLIETVTGGAA